MAVLSVKRAVKYISVVFFFNDTATTEIYTLSLHDALPICRTAGRRRPRPAPGAGTRWPDPLLGCVPAWRSLLSCPNGRSDRKSTRLNSSHANISYAVFCLKKKKKNYMRNLKQYYLHTCISA